MGENIVYKHLRNAKVHADNSGDTDRVYDISADVQLNESGVEYIEVGSISLKDSDITLASFNTYGINSLSVVFTLVEEDNMCTVLTAINSFIADVKEKVNSTIPLSLQYEVAH